RSWGRLTILRSVALALPFESHMNHVSPSAQAPIALGKLRVVEYGTAEFRADSVRILAAAVAKGPMCRVLPRDSLGLLSFREVDAAIRDPRTFSSRFDLIPAADGMRSRAALLGDDPPAHTR